MPGRGGADVPRKRFEDEVDRLLELGYDRRTAEEIARIAVAGHGDVIAYDEKGRMIEALDPNEPHWSNSEILPPDPTKPPPRRY